MKHSSGRRKFNTSEREYILKKSDNKCARCGCKLSPQTATIDHVFPLDKGGLDDEYNLLALCGDCNEKKSNYVYYVSDFYKYISDEYKETYEDYFIRASKDHFQKSLLGVDENVLFYTPYSVMKVARSMASRGASHHKIQKLIDKNRAYVIIKKAYPADASNMLKEISRRETKNLLMKECIYKTEDELADAIENAKASFIIEKGGDLKGSFVFEKYNYVMKGYSEYAQLTNVIEQTGLSGRYVLTYAPLADDEELDCNENRVFKLFLLQMVSNGWLPIIFLNNCEGISTEYICLPHNFLGVDGFLVFPTVKKIRTLIKSIALKNKIFDDLSLSEDELDTLVTCFIGNPYLEDVLQNEEAKILFENYPELEELFVKKDYPLYNTGFVIAILHNKV